MCITLVAHRVGEFGQVWQQFSLQADGCQTEAGEQAVSSQAVVTVLRGTTEVSPYSLDVQPLTNILPETNKSNNDLY